MRIRIMPFNSQSPLFLSPFPLRGLSALVSCHPCDIIHNVRDMCLALATAPAPTATKSLHCDIMLPLFLEQRFLCPLVSFSQRCVRISRYHRHPCLASPPPLQHPLLALPPAYLCICRGRKHLHCGSSKTPHYKRDAHL